MSERGLDRAWRFYVEDMLAFAEKARKYTDRLNQEQFVRDDLVFDATLRNLELIGEAATHVPDSVRSNLSQVPWRQIIATRNRLIHACLGVDEDTVWSIVRDDLP